MEPVSAAVETLIQETAFTKVVETPAGEGLLIGGYVIELKCANPLMIEVISRALRRGGIGQGSISAATANHAGGNA